MLLAPNYVPPKLMPPIPPIYPAAEAPPYNIEAPIGLDPGPEYY